MRGSGFQQGAARVASLAMFFLFAYAGMVKWQDPGPTTRFLSSLLETPFPQSLTSVLGGAEVALAVWIASGWKLAWSALAAAAGFVSFTIAHLSMAVMGNSKPCGCLGKGLLSEASPWAWAAISAGACVIAVVTSRIAAQSLPLPQEHAA